MFDFIIQSLDEGTHARQELSQCIAERARQFYAVRRKLQEMVKVIRIRCSDDGVVQVVTLIEAFFYTGMV